jgi:hypothetical protein
MHDYLGCYMLRFEIGNTTSLMILQFFGNPSINKNSALEGSNKEPGGGQTLLFTV